MTSDPPGLDLTALRGWLDAAAPGLVEGPIHAELITGGKSNLTYRVSDGSSAVVVRRPPLGHVLVTAHDMAREHRVMSALHETAVPVPRMLALCADASVVGAPFYVMELVDGVPYRTAESLETLGEKRTRQIADEMVDTLADLHMVDPAAVGLADFGRPQGFLARQVRRWGQQLDASSTRDLAGADELRRLLEQGVPTNGDRRDSAVVHGDYRLDNLLVTSDGTGDHIAAVVDWEMATLGDPLTDVALLLTYHRLADLGLGAVVSDAATAPGFPSRDDVTSRYVARTGRSLDQLAFHEALACFKLAVILEGIHYRDVHAQTVGGGFAGIGTMVEPLIDMGLDAVRRPVTEHPVTEHPMTEPPMTEPPMEEH
ncbi:phosphotransferase family protein [Lapillicoccus sp.]|uniref:phosphotransferase family protein n=1 Tax=Lapillicoccus sp. TaxID=1909287 RepID=UPI00326769EB